MNELLKEYQGEYENACEDMYYGIGYKTWYEQQVKFGSDISEENAKKIWKMAFEKMSKDNW